MIVGARAKQTMTIGCCAPFRDLGSCSRTTILSRRLRFDALFAWPNKRPSLIDWVLDRVFRQAKRRQDGCQGQLRTPQTDIPSVPSFFVKM
jgi:hypothetical protein